MSLSKGSGKSQKLSKTICRILVSFQVWPNLKWESRLGDEEPAHKMTERNEWQREMARLAARWRRFNLVILITLRKGNHPGEAYVRRGQRKALYKREIDSL